MQTILVPVDFSETSEYALDYAIRFAKELHARVHVLHSYEIPAVGLPEGAMVMTADIAGRIMTSSKAALEATVTQRKDSGVELLSTLRSGDPRVSIGEVAKEISADLIVMGTHGRRGVVHFLLGSITEYVVRTSDIPVLTVRHPSK